MNAAVTGGTGFLGRPLLQMLKTHAGEVRALVRRPEDDEAVRALGATPIRGDLTVAGGCRDLVRQGDVVFHAAARVDLAGTWRDFVETTVVGTRGLLNEALPANPARFVYVSSAAVYAVTHARGGAAADRTPTGPPRFNFYARAKLAAENLVRVECNRVGCPWTIVRLGFLYGPGNRALRRYFESMMQRGRLRVVGDGRNRMATLYVEDAARAVVLAGAHETAVGRIYDVASDEIVTQRMFLYANADAFDLRRPNGRVPSFLAYAAAAMAEMSARLRGRPPSLTRAMVVLMSFDQVLDASRIRRELAWMPQVCFDEGIRRTHAWIRNGEQQENRLSVG